MNIEWGTLPYPTELKWKLGVKCNLKVISTCPPRFPLAPLKCIFYIILFPYKREAGQLGLVPTRPGTNSAGSTRPVYFPYGESGYHICT